MLISKFAISFVGLSQYNSSMNMKKIFPITLISLIILTCMTGCQIDSDMIWDVAGYTIKLDVRDENGHSLLQPGVAGCIVGDDIEVVYHGDSYHAVWSDLESADNESTRAYMAVFEGLVYREQTSWSGDELKKNGYYLLELGELPRDETYEALILLRYDGKEHQILVRNQYKTKASSNKPVINTWVYFDGEIVDNDCIILRK